MRQGRSGPGSVSANALRRLPPPNVGPEVTEHFLPSSLEAANDLSNFTAQEGIAIC